MADRKMVRLIRQFLNAGILSEGQFLRTEAGTPQGGVLSPLLSNIALSAIEERYERWVEHRSKLRTCRTCDGMQAANSARQRDRKAGRPVFFPVRYADDFVILVAGTQNDAETECQALAEYLRRTTGLELSPEKTKVTAMDAGFEFLGQRVHMRWDRRYGYCPRVEIPKAKVKNLRYKVKQMTARNTTLRTLGQAIQDLNPVLRGWANYYRYCAGAHRVFTSIDWYTHERLWRWLRKKRPKASWRDLARSYKPSVRRTTRKLWQDGGHEQYLLAWTPVCRYRLAWMGSPSFAMSSGKPDA